MSRHANDAVAGDRVGRIEGPHVYRGWGEGSQAGQQESTFRRSHGLCRVVPVESPAVQHADGLTHPDPRGRDGAREALADLPLEEGVLEDRRDRTISRAGQAPKITHKRPGRCRGPAASRTADP